MRIAICSRCGEERRIVFGWSTRNRKLCTKCNNQRKPKKKSISKSVSKPLREKKAEDEKVNGYIWNSRKHQCIECLAPLPSPPKKHYFSHLLSKGAHPELRFSPKNIVLHCFVCHQKWEFGGSRKEMRTYWENAGFIQDHSTL